MNENVNKEESIYNENKDNNNIKNELKNIYLKILTIKML